MPDPHATGSRAAILNEVAASMDLVFDRALSAALEEATGATETAIEDAVATAFAYVAQVIQEMKRP